MKRQDARTRILLSLLLVVAAASLTAGAQTIGPPDWAWMGGSNKLPGNCTGGYTTPAVCGYAGACGKLGTTAAGNLPGSRIGAATWTDKQGNFWLFGGWGFDDGKSDSSPNGLVLGVGDLNDLWEFAPLSQYLGVGRWEQHRSPARGLRHIGDGGIREHSPATRWCEHLGR